MARYASFGHVQDAYRETRGVPKVRRTTTFTTRRHGHTLTFDVHDALKMGLVKP
jgi:hypothetical protein